MLIPAVGVGVFGNTWGFFEGFEGRYICLGGAVAGEISAYRNMTRIPPRIW